MMRLFAILRGSSFEHDYTASAKEKRKENLKNEASQLQTNTLQEFCLVLCHSLF